MDPTVLKLAVSAFMHDMGKFASPAEMGFSPRELDEYDKQLYLPSSQGRYSHYHSLYTAEFFNRYRDMLPPELHDRGWGQDDIPVNLAAKHHNPETVFQWIITIADRISSGLDRKAYEDAGHSVAVRDYKTTRLVTLFEQLSRAVEHPGAKDSFKYVYPLEPVNAASVFPVKKEPDSASGRAEAEKEYQELFSRFITELEQLLHRDTDVELWFDHFESLMMRYTSHIPSARAGNTVPDVSLYDHLRTTAALAAAIYLFHRDTGTLTEESVRSYGDRKFLLVSGDFRGIQNYIFARSGSSSRFRSKILRGRSFSVSLYSELAADMLCRKIGVPGTSVVLNAAGKFTIIAPNTDLAKQAVSETEALINQWLAGIAYGETVISISTVEASSNDFVSQEFHNLWDRICTAADDKKCRGIDLEVHGGAVENYLHSFTNRPGGPALCPICGKRPAMDDSGSYLRGQAESCGLCRDHIFMGTNLVRKSFMALVGHSGNTSGESMLYMPVYGEYQLVFADAPESLISKGYDVLKLWDIRVSGHDNGLSGVTRRYINAHVPLYTSSLMADERIQQASEREKDPDGAVGSPLPGDPVTFNHIAAFSRTPRGDGYSGIEALGILKADIDYLGFLMACGLPDNRLTLSRLATLSRQINYYFSVFLPRTLSSEPGFQLVYTVFAGGDDLFLIGPWNAILKLAGFIQKTFGAYTCDNPDITLSAGITMHKVHSPVDAMAEASEAELKRAKAGGRDRLTLYGETLQWQDLPALADIRQTFETWLSKGWISRVMFYRLNTFIRMAGEEKQLQNRSSVSLQEMECTKWRAYLVYAVERNIGKSVARDERKAVVREVSSKLSEWLGRFGSSLKIPVWTILYQNR